MTHPRYATVKASSRIKTLRWMGSYNNFMSVKNASAAHLAKDVGLGKSRDYAGATDI